MKKEGKEKENTKITPKDNENTRKSPDINEIAYGYYDTPFRVIKDEIALSLENDNDSEMFLYKRELLGEKVEKVLLAYNGSILLNPVEPLNMPREITSYLLLEFGKVLMVEPLAKKKVFIKFPIEIGVFVTGKEIFDVLDVFSVVKSKFSLYGNPSSGVVCKYHKSEVYPLLPSVDTLREGVMELTITNTTNKWVEVTKAVFNAYGMKIYYNDRLVSMKSNMKVLSTKVAETDFVDSPLEKGMIKSLELYTARKLSITTPKFIMEGEI